eukprot:2986895-Rhodomonas_salina.1
MTTPRGVCDAASVPLGCKVCDAECGTRSVGHDLVDGGSEDDKVAHAARGEPVEQHREAKDEQHREYPHRAPRRQGLPATGTQ